MKTTYGKMWSHWHIETLREKYPDQGSNIPELLEAGFTQKAIVKKASLLEIRISDKFKKERNAKGAAKYKENQLAKRTPLERLFYSLLQNAIKTSKRTNRNLINKEDVDELVQVCVKLYHKQGGVCAISKEPLPIPSSDLNVQEFLNTSCISIDRTDSKIGYIESNIEIVHKDLNFMKQDYSKEYYIEFCKKVAAHNVRNNSNNVFTGIYTIHNDLLSVHMVGLHY